MNASNISHAFSGCSSLTIDLNHTGFLPRLCLFVAGRKQLTPVDVKSDSWASNYIIHLADVGTASPQFVFKASSK